jgi:hypothetical protein
MDGSKLVASSLGYEKSPEDIQSLYNGGPARIEMMMLMSAGGPAAARTAEEWRAIIKRQKLEAEMAQRVAAAPRPDPRSTPLSRFDWGHRAEDMATLLGAATDECTRGQLQAVCEARCEVTSMPVDAGWSGCEAWQLAVGPGRLAMVGKQGERRARSRCRVVRPPIHCIPDSLTYSVFSLNCVKRQCDRTPGERDPFAEVWLQPAVAPTDTLLGQAARAAVRSLPHAEVERVAKELAGSEYISECHVHLNWSIVTRAQSHDRSPAAAALQMHRQTERRGAGQGHFVNAPMSKIRRNPKKPGKKLQEPKKPGKKLQIEPGFPGQVKKTPSLPRSLTNFSHLQLYSHMNAWANLHLLGQPNTFLAPEPLPRARQPAGRAHLDRRVAHRARSFLVV